MYYVMASSNTNWQWLEEKLQGRYRDVVDEYYNYMNEYPEIT